MNILITLCARGGSKGIPGKNIKHLNGKPLLAYSIDTARAFMDTRVNDTTVLSLSTDSDEIRAVATDYNLHSTYNRPEHLANDTAGKIDAIRHLLEYEEKERGCRFDMVIDLDVTSPLRTVQDLQEAFAKLEAEPEAINLFSVNKAHKNPYFNMVEKDGHGFYNLSKTVEGVVLTRQSAPGVYELNASFYIYRRHFFEKYNKAITDRSTIYEMKHLCFDLDEPIDFEFLDYLLRENKLSFSL